MVLPYIKMNPPQVYMCSPSRNLLPPPSPYHPSGSSQCTSPKHPVSCIKPGLATRFIYDIIHVSMPSLYTKQQKRHWCIEQSFGLCGRGRGWDDLEEWHLGEWHWNIHSFVLLTTQEWETDFFSLIKKYLAQIKPSIPVSSTRTQVSPLPLIICVLLHP